MFGPPTILAAQGEMIDTILSNGGPWALFAGFVGLLISFNFWVLRQMVRGRLVQGVIYDDVCEQRNRWQAVAETGLSVNRDLTDHVGRLVATNERIIESQRDTEQLVRNLIATTSRRDAS